jgi:hypothetical protein
MMASSWLGLWLKKTTNRERAIAETPACIAASQAALYPLSYRRMERRAGFEPATSRFADEVTAIFTTERGWGRRGTHRRLALFNEVTVIFTTA